MWQPKDSTTILDRISSSAYTNFPFALLRNEHVVALYLTRIAVDRALTDRRQKFPDDNWSIRIRIA